MNDRPTDTFSGEAGRDPSGSLPRKRTNGTAPRKVACQSPSGENGEQKSKQEVLKMANEIFMRVDEVAAELGVSVPYAYKLIRQLNEELKKTGCITIAGRIDRKFFHEKFYGTKERNQ